MANLVRIDPSKFCADEAWYVFDDGRSYLRKIDQSGPSERGPAIISDHIDPLTSMADGRMYDSKSALYRSYRADGNPQGVRYECIGEHVAQPFKRPKRDKEQSIQAIKRALGEL